MPAPFVIPHFSRRVAAGIFASALLLRLVYLWEDASSPLFLAGGIDSLQYDQMASAYVRGDWPEKFTFFWTPAYSWFLGVIYLFFGDSPVAAKVIQSLLGSVSCVLVYVVGLLAFERRAVAIGAAVACVASGPLIFFDGQLVTANLDVLFQLLILLFLLVADRLRTLPLWAAAGFCLGLSTINRGGQLLFLPLVLFWILRRPEAKGAPPPWKEALAVVLPMFLVIAPITLHNLRYDERVPPKINEGILKRLFEGRFSLVSHNVGINLRLGNDWALREINEVTHPLCFVEYKRLVEAPWKAGASSGSEHSRKLTKATWEIISQKPGDWLKLMGLKLFRLLNGAERPRNIDIYADRLHSRLLSVLLWKNAVAFPSGLILPLGLIGFALALRAWRRHYFLLGSIATQWLFILAFFPTSRYRLPSLVLLTLLGAFAAVWFWETFRARKHHLGVPWLAGLVGLFFVSNSYLGEMPKEHSPFEYVHLGNTYATKGDMEKAIEANREALRIDPDFAPAHFDLGMYLKASDPAQAIHHLEQGLSVAPMATQPQLQLGLLYAESERPQESIERFETALSYDPNEAEAHFYLARHRFEAKEMDRALEHLLTAVRIDPRYTGAHIQAARLYSQMNNRERALFHLERAIEAEPDNREAQEGLNYFMGQQGEQPGKP